MIFAFLSFGITEIILVLVIMLIPVIALVDILRSKFEPINKLIWVLVVIFTNLLGALLYFLIGKNQKIK